MRFPHLNPAASWQAARTELARLRYGADEFMAGPPDPEAYADPTAHANRRLLWLDGLVSNISESFVTSFIYPFVMALGATNGQIGAMSALTNLGAALGLLPGARLAERFGRKQVAVLTGGVAGRLLPRWTGSLRTPGALSSRRACPGVSGRWRCRPISETNFAPRSAAISSG